VHTKWNSIYACREIKFAGENILLAQNILLTFAQNILLMYALLVITFWGTLLGMYCFLGNLSNRAKKKKFLNETFNLKHFLITFKLY